MSEPEKEVAIKCNNCKQLVNENSDYCINCGYPLKIFDKAFYSENPKKSFKSQGLIGYLKHPENALLTVNVCIFLIMLIPGFIHPRISNSLFFFLPGPSNYAILSGVSERVLIMNGDYWRLFSAVYLHANIIHIAFNMIFLKQIFPFTKHFYNWSIFFVVFSIAGVVGNLAAMMFEGPVVGASGALFGIVGSLIVLGRLSRSVLGLTIYTVLGKWTLIMLVFGFLMPGISNAAHLGGLFSGMLMGYLIYNPRYKIPSYSRLLYYICLALSGYGIYMTLSNLYVLINL